MQVNEDDVKKGLEVFARVASEWAVDRSSVGAIVYKRIDYGMDAAVPIEGDRATMYRFDTFDEGISFKREKIVRAIIEAL